MKKFLHIFIGSLPFFMSSILPVSSRANPVDPIYQLLEDEQDRMTINQIPFELDPISLGIDVLSEERMKKFLNPPFVEETLIRWVDHLVTDDLRGGPTPSSSLLERDQRVASVPLPLLMERAKEFQKVDLAPIAREQFTYILSLYPRHKEASDALASLTSSETEKHLKSALQAQRSANLETALFQVKCALDLSPKNSRALDLKRKLLQEEKLQKELRVLISKDYLTGIEHYQNGRLDNALAYFVRVLNFDPSHKQALDYIQKIGDRLKLTSPEGARKP